MKPFDPHEVPMGQPGHPGQPAKAPRSAEAGGPGDPLRGLADPAQAPGGVVPAPGAAQRLSLWARIKRAFQYGSQGGETG